MPKDYYNEYLSAKIRNVDTEEDLRAKKNSSQLDVLKDRYKRIKAADGDPVSDLELADIAGSKEDKAKAKEAIIQKGKDSDLLFDKARAAQATVSKTLNSLGEGAISTLDKFDTLRRVVGFQLTDKLSRIKKDIDKNDYSTGAVRAVSGDIAAETYSALKNKESVVSALKSLGARKEEMHKFSIGDHDERSGYNADFNDTMSTVLGNEAWSNISSVIDKYAQLPESARTVDLKPFSMFGSDKTIKVDFKKATESAFPVLEATKRWNLLTDIAYQTLTDPLTYIPFGLPVKLAGNATKLLFKGSLSQAAKIKGMAEVIDKSSTAMGNLAERVISNFDLKYPASKSAREILGESGATALFENIDATARAPKRHLEANANKIKELQAEADLMPLSEQVLEKVTGFRPAINEMAKAKSIQEWDGRVASAMQALEVDAGVQHANIFKTELADAVKTIGADLGFTDKQIAALRNRVSVLRSTKHVNELDKAGNKVTIEYAKDLEKLMVESRDKLLGQKGLASEIARDRRDASIAMVKGNYKIWKNARREAIHNAKLEEKSIRKSANNLVRETSKKYTLEKNKVILDAQKTLEDKLKLVRTAKINPSKKSEMIKSINSEFESFTKNFEENSLKGLTDQYGDIVSKYQEGMSSKVDDFLTGIPNEASMVKDYKKSLGIIETKYQDELKGLNKNITGIKFTDIYNKAMIKYKGIADSVFEKNMAGLDDAGKKLAREIRAGFDERAQAEIAAGLYNNPIPEYYSRMLKKQPILEFDPDATTAFSKGSGTAFKKGRLEGVDSYKDFSKSVEAKGGEALESARETYLARDLISRVELGRQKVWDSLPNELKVGKHRNNMIKYLDYVFLGKSDLNKGKAGRNAFGNMVDRFTFANKAMLTVFSPTFYFRNIAGFPFLAANESGVKAFDPRNIADFFAAKTGVSKIVSNGKMSIKSEQFFKEMFDRNVTISSFSRGNIVENARWMLNDFKKTDPRYYMAKSLHAAQATEDFGRMYSAFTLFKQGKSLDDAAKYSKKAMYTFDNFNVIDKALSGIMTFYSFSRKNLVGTLKTMMKDPKQLALMDRVITGFMKDQRPSDEDIRSLNEWDKDKITIFGDFVKGGQLMQSLGFTPYEDVYTTVSPLLNGEWTKFLNKNIIEKLNPVEKMTYSTLTHIKQVGGDKNIEYGTLPREFLSKPGTVKLLGKVSKMLTTYGLVEKDVIRRVNGTPQYEKQYKLPNIMIDLVGSRPWGRVEGDYRRMVQTYADKTGKHPAEVTVLDIIKSGYIKDPKGLVKFLTGISEKTVDFEYLKRNKSNAEYYKFKKRMETEGLLTPYGMPKAVKSKYYNDLKK